MTTRHDMDKLVIARRTAVALESIATSLEKLALPPTVADWGRLGYVTKEAQEADRLLKGQLDRCKVCGEIIGWIRFPDGVGWKLVHMVQTSSGVFGWNYNADHGPEMKRLTCACGQFPRSEYGAHCPSCRPLSAEDVSPGGSL